MVDCVPIKALHKSYFFQNIEYYYIAVRAVASDIVANAFFSFVQRILRPLVGTKVQTCDK